jgi:hypothetical protein
MRSFLPAMSKMPPENLQAALQLRQAFAQRTDFHGAESITPPRALRRAITADRAGRSA